MMLGEQRNNPVDNRIQVRGVCPVGTLFLGTTDREKVYFRMICRIPDTSGETEIRNGLPVATVRQDRAHGRKPSPDSRPPPSSNRCPHPPHHVRAARHARCMYSPKISRTDHRDFHNSISTQEKLQGFFASSSDNCHGTVSHWHRKMTDRGVLRAPSISLMSGTEQALRDLDVVYPVLATVPLDFSIGFFSILPGNGGSCCWTLESGR